ncbi:MAG TPA: hypothetical protein VF092_16065 [Longimicrobium sp.]
MVATRKVAKAATTPTPARPVAPLALDRNTQRALRELRALRADRDELDQKIKDRESKIKAAMGAHEEASVGGVVQVTWKAALRQSMDQTKLKENYPDAAAACMKQAYVRTFKILGDA